MTKSESERAIRFLCGEWAKLLGISRPPVEQPSFSEFLSWVQQNHSSCLNFRSTVRVEDEVERWFDEEFNQSWRN